MNMIGNVIIGQSLAIEKLLSQIRNVARNPNVTVLVTGESGTGKELVARMLHSLGDQAHQPFVDVNCGAIPEALLESELFGYMKGAFTGATDHKKGLFELADGGTIFLDEIGDTTPAFQVKLLKAVENKRFRRIGGIQDVTVSTRIIAATNVDLLQAVQEDKFREDLYYRLNVCELRVPPLRVRGEDILLLAEHFVLQAKKQYNRQVIGLSDKAQTEVMTYRWPGNVRQLKNAIHRAILTTDGRFIEPEHLSLHRPRDGRAPKQESSGAATPAEVDLNALSYFDIPDEGISLEDVERKLLLGALRKAGGNLSKAARLVKISRGKLRYRLEKLNIESRDAMALTAVQLLEDE